MPKWVPFEQVGILMRDGPYLVLSMPGGGYWRLEDVRLKREMLGTSVRVKGTRIGFNDISVDSIEAA